VSACREEEVEVVLPRMFVCVCALTFYPPSFPPQSSALYLTAPTLPLHSNTLTYNTCTQWALDSYINRDIRDDVAAEKALYDGVEWAERWQVSLSHTHTFLPFLSHI